MKKLVLLVLIVSLNPLSAFTSPIQQFGLKGGLTSANQEFSGVYWVEENAKRKIGFNAGIFAEFFDCAGLSLLAQIEYTQKGTVEEFRATDELGNNAGLFRTTSTLNYLSLPLSAKYEISIQQIVPYVIAGLRYDHLLNHESVAEGPEELQVGSEPGTFVLENTIYDHFSRNIFGAQIGAGVTFDLFSGFKPALEFRYNLDLTNSLSEEGQKAKNNSFDISLFLPIDL
jgi:opacity protein-like surface antigen